MFQHDRKLKIAGVVVTTIVVGAFMTRALSKYLAGDGIETYRNVNGALMNYAGALVTGVVFVVCVVAALVARWWHYRQERKFEAIIKAREADTEHRKTAESGS